jgi:hypothetical protein
MIYDFSREARALSLIRSINSRLKLDLQKTIVLTEMGFGHFVYTPFIAALAGAEKVFSLVKDSPYGIADELSERGGVIAKEWGLSARIEIIRDLPASVVSKADIITNLGFLRPLDRHLIKLMKNGAVIPYMREAWEYRPEDVDLEACAEYKIPVMGTYENYQDLEIFDYSGALAAKLLFEAGLEVKGNRILLISGDGFGEVIAPYLEKIGVKTILVNPRDEIQLETMPGLDAIFAADFTFEKTLIGAGGWLDPLDILLYHPGCVVVQLAGAVDPTSLARSQIKFFPKQPAPAKRMSKTLAYLGPKPVIDLHAAGLKVGELMLKEYQSTQDPNRIMKNLSFPGSLCQPVLPILS